MSAHFSSYTLLFQQKDFGTIHVLLSSLFKRHDGNTRLVAQEIGIHQRTLFTWLTKLEEQGLPDPRGGRRAKLGRKPKIKHRPESAGKAP